MTEEILFELFVQAGPLVKTKIPKDPDGKQKTFGFAVYKHEVSVPYAMQLLNGTLLFGKAIHVQFRSGSSHGNSPGYSQKSSPANTANPHGQRSPAQLSSPPYTPPQMQQLFSPDNLQKQITMNNMMWQLQMQQFAQLPVNNNFSKPSSRPPSGGGSRQHNSLYQNQVNSGRGQRYTNESGPGRHQQHGHSRDNYFHQNESGSRHHDNRSVKRHHGERGNNRNYQDTRWRR